jgi:hypothetical protein
VTASNSGETLIITNNDTGNVTDASDEDTGFTFNVTQQGVDPTAYLTIQSGQNESDGSAIWIPTAEHSVLIDKGELFITDAATIGDELEIKITFTGFGGNGQDADFDYEYIKYTLGEGIGEKFDDIYQISNADPPANSKITLSEIYYSNSNDGFLKMRILLIE